MKQPSPRKSRRGTPNPATHRTCPTGKVRLRDQHEATLLLTLLRRKRADAEASGVPTTRYEDRSYECGLCSGWHLTSQAAPVSVAVVPLTG